MKLQFNTTQLRHAINAGLFDAVVLFLLIGLFLPINAWLVSLDEIWSNLVFGIPALLTFLVFRPLSRHWAASLQRREDARHNLQHDAGGEKRLVRALTEPERQILQGATKRSVINIVGLLAIIWITGLVFWVFAEGTVPIPWVLLICTLLSLSVANTESKQRKNLRLDLHLNAAMQVEGELIREITESKRSRVVEFVVRGERFTERHLPEIDKLADQFAEDEWVRVVFSPYSHMVWAITSLEDRPQPEKPEAAPELPLFGPIDNRQPAVPVNPAEDLSQQLWGK